MIKVKMMLMVKKNLPLTVPITPLAAIVVPLVLEYGEHQHGEVGDHLEDDNEEDHNNGGEQNGDDDFIGGEARNHLDHDDGGNENVDYDSNVGKARYHLQDNVDADHDDGGSEC